MSSPLEMPRRRHPDAAPCAHKALYSDREVAVAELERIRSAPSQYLDGLPVSVYWCWRHDGWHFTKKSREESW